MRSLAFYFLLFYFELETYAAPAASSVEKASKLAKRKSSRRVNILPDPAEVLIIPDISEPNAEAILRDLGYNEIDQNDDDLRIIGLTDSSERALSEIISIFQHDNDIPVTGVLDDETKLAIGRPHCGSKKSAKLKGADRKWSKNVLTYSIENYPRGKRMAPIQSMLLKAFNEWSKVTNLDFVEVDGVDADIEINFGGRIHKQRGSRCTFDDPNTLAHAFFPEVGDIHFHNKYFFNDEDVTMEDFLDTAMHEIGHSLGLEHSRSKASLMHPTESNRFNEPQPIDIKNIQVMYGVRRGGRSMNIDAPKLCSLEKIDAAIQESDGNLYIFAGNFYYNLNEKRPIGRLISSKWPGLPGNIDAALRYGDGRSYFFKGNKYWRFADGRLNAGHPRLISEGFRGLPSDIDALMSDEDGDIFAMKGNQYWVYDVSKRRVGSEYPAKMRDMGLPNNVDAALDTEDEVVAFRGGLKYVLQQNGRFKVDENDWLVCAQ
ncbi:stromelysin-3-like [Armigeres subalbatus]|uniref:stromelysin-3-like n=1 Tax=Armigeres subalbatus TaxID=124917 RepID=UPI002ECFDE28